MSKQHCISRYIDNSRPCNGWWGSYGALEIVGLLLLLLSFISDAHGPRGLGKL